MTRTLLASDPLGLRGIASFRRPIRGPEDALVSAFIEHLPFRPEKGHEHALFREPRLELRAPDLIYVTWRADVVRSWPQGRTRLHGAHFKILQQLHTLPRAARVLAAKPPAATRGLLDDLELAGLLSWRNSRVQLLPLHRAFAATRIVAVEAKIKEWRRVTDQAFANTWFASESYVLAPKPPRDERTLPRAKALGLGVWLQGDSPRRLIAPRRYPLPASFASWQVNNWLMHL